jgi:uncharacterized protein YgiM (DUF1202 family)
MRATRVFFALLFLLISAALSGCKNNDDKAGTEDLPDLGQQTRPYITTANTIARTGPGEQFRPVSKVPANAKVHVVGRDGEWLLIISKKGNAPGFIPMSSAERGTGGEPAEAEAQTQSAAGPYEILANTQLHSGPGLHYPVVVKVPKGTRINVVEEQSGWLRVQSKHGREPGYVEARLARPAQSRANRADN